MNVVETVWYLIYHSEPPPVPVLHDAGWDEPEHRPARSLTPQREPDVTPDSWPTHGRITSRFGPRARPRPGASENHAGVDIAAPIGTAVWATSAGRVSSVRDRSGYGLTVVIDHGGGVQSLYGHLSAAHVREGENVSTHQLIGEVGATGIVTGAHLHYERRRDGRAVHPGIG